MQNGQKKNIDIRKLEVETEIMLNLQTFVPTGQKVLAMSIKYSVVI